MWVCGCVRGAASYIAAAVSESLQRGVTKVGGLEVGREIVEEGDVVHLEWVSWFEMRGRGTDLCYLSETDDTNS